MGKGHSTYKNDDVKIITKSEDGNSIEVQSKSGVKYWLPKYSEELYIPNELYGLRVREIHHQVRESTITHHMALRPIEIGFEHAIYYRRQTSKRKSSQAWIEGKLSKVRDKLIMK